MKNRNHTKLKAALKFRLDQGKAFHGYANVPHLGWSEPVRGTQRVIFSPERAGLRVAKRGKSYACGETGTFRAVVLALPARRGVPRYLAAYETAWRDGGHFVECSRIIRDLPEAIHAADAFAKIEAAREHYREGLICDDPESYPI